MNKEINLTHERGTGLKGLRAFLFLSILFSLTVLSARASFLNDYRSLTACEKQEVLWNKIEKTKHKKLPRYNKLGLVQVIKMALQKIEKKADYASDFAPKGWKKYLHKRGAVAKVKFIPSGNSSFTGVFAGAECGLIRLSLTYRPGGKKGVAPGLALKILRDKTASGNVSALYTLSGQGDEYNFFKNPLSNIVPMGSSFGEKVVHSIFKKVSEYPEELELEDLGEIDSKGVTITKASYPRQIFFVPNRKDIKFPSSAHEIRNDLMTIPEGTVLYKVYALTKKKKDYDYFNYTIEQIEDFVKESQKIGEIVSTSNFIASEFGDTGIFFKHQVR